MREIAIPHSLSLTERYMYMPLYGWRSITGTKNAERRWSWIVSVLEKSRDLSSSTISGKLARSPHLLLRQG